MSENEKGFKPSKDAGVENPQPGDVKIVDGIKYQYKKSKYSLRQFYSHETPEMGPGPGWDVRMGLLNDEWAMKNFGRTFSAKEVFNPSLLPDLPMYEWSMVDD